MLQSLRGGFQGSAILSRLGEVTRIFRDRRKLRLPQPTALIVDDDPDVAPLVRAALGPFAISVEDVLDGAAALERLRANRYDLVILDLAMNGLNGFDVLQTLKKQALLRAIPVIVLTANANDESLARSFGYGADDFVIKPFKPTELGMRAYRLLYPLITA